jgi:hypothetical protein
VLDEFTIWLRDMLAARGVAVSTIAASYAAIASVLGDACPRSVAMLERSSALLVDPA